MAHTLFSDAWALAWRDQLEASDDYRTAAADWEGDLALVLSGEVPAGMPSAVWVDLHHGRCRDARSAVASDLDGAAYVLEADLSVWQRTLEGQLKPLWALMSKKIRLRRGRLSELTPYARAAAELVAAAGRVPTAFSATHGESTDAGTSATRPRAEPPPPISFASQNGRVFQTTSERSIDFASPAMRLFQKGKRLGVWDPQTLDLARDREDWLRLDDLQQTVILHLCSLFQAGEEAVTLDLLPLIQAIAAEGRLEEEMYLTSFLFEEAKHVEFFARFFAEVAARRDDCSHFHGPSYRAIFYEALPTALQRLRHDPSPEAQAEASVTYNMIVEGVLAETGYHAFHAILRRHALMPGTLEGVALLKSDESRHLAYGVFLLSRLVAVHGEPIWWVIEERMQRLLEPALGVVEDIFATYPEMPFGLTQEEFSQFALGQFQRRLERIERARRHTLEEVLGQSFEDPVEQPASGREPSP